MIVLFGHTHGGLNMIKVLIVDNELLAGVRIERRLMEMRNIVFVGQATSGQNAVAMIAAQSPDIVLMKTVKPDKGHVSFSEIFNRSADNPLVVFCPVLDQIEFKRQRDNLVGALLNASKAVHLERRALCVGARSHLYVYSYQGIDAIPIKQVRLLKADQKYVKVYTVGANFTVSETLKNLEQEFPHLFVRIHRNALVLKDAIEGIQSEEGRTSAIIRGIDIRPQISRRLEPKLRKFMSRL